MRPKKFQNHSTIKLRAKVGFYVTCLCAIAGIRQFRLINVTPSPKAIVFGDSSQVRWPSNWIICLWHRGQGRRPLSQIISPVPAPPKISRSIVSGKMPRNCCCWMAAGHEIATPLHAPVSWHMEKEQEVSKGCQHIWHKFLWKWICINSHDMLAPKRRSSLPCSYDQAWAEIVSAKRAKGLSSKGGVGCEFATQFSKWEASFDAKINHDMARLCTKWQRCSQADSD